MAEFGADGWHYSDADHGHEDRRRDSGGLADGGAGDYGLPAGERATPNDGTGSGVGHVSQRDRHVSQLLPESAFWQFRTEMNIKRLKKPSTADRKVWKYKKQWNKPVTP